MTSPTVENPVEYRVLGTVPKAEDLEVAVRLARIGEEVMIDIRDYVPSVQFYGRGVVVPIDSAFGLAQLISDARNTAYAGG